MDPVQRPIGQVHLIVGGEVRGRGHRQHAVGPNVGGQLGMPHRHRPIRVRHEVDRLMHHRVAGPRALFARRAVDVRVERAQVDRAQTDCVNGIEFRIRTLERRADWARAMPIGDRYSQADRVEIDGVVRSAKSNREKSRADHIEGGEDVVSATTDVTKTRMLSEGHQSSRVVDVFRSRHIDACTSRCAFDLDGDEARGDVPHVETSQLHDTIGLVRGVLIEQHLTHRIVVVVGADHVRRRQQRRRVMESSWERSPHRWLQRTERRTGRRLSPVGTRVQRGDDERRTPMRVVKIRVRPSPAMFTSVERLQRETSHVAGNRHRSPCVTGRRPPRLITHHPHIAHQRFEHQRSGAQRVGGWNGNPP